MMYAQSNSLATLPFATVHTFVMLSQFGDMSETQTLYVALCTPQPLRSGPDDKILISFFMKNIDETRNWIVSSKTQEDAKNRFQEYAWDCPCKIFDGFMSMCEVTFASENFVNLVMQNKLIVMRDHFRYHDDLPFEGWSSEGKQVLSVKVCPKEAD